MGAQPQEPTMSQTNRLRIDSRLLITAIFLLGTSRVWAADAPAAPPATQPAMTELEQQFAARMTNAVMAGNYTLGEKGTPKADRYTIVSVRKLKDDNWLFTARVQFGDKDVTIPMIIPV